MKAVAILGLLTAVASVVGQASAAGSVTTAVRCSLRAHLTAPLAQTGAIIGSVTCGHSIGKGRYNGRYRDNVAHWPTVSETGCIKAVLQVREHPRHLHAGPSAGLRARAVPRDVSHHGRYWPTQARHRDTGYDLRSPDTGANSMHDVGIRGWGPAAPRRFRD